MHITGAEQCNYLYVCLSVRLFIIACLSLWSSVCMFVCVCICLFVCLFVCLSVCLVCMCVRLYVGLFFFSFYMFAFLFLCVFFLSVCFVFQSLCLFMILHSQWPKLVTKARHSDNNTIYRIIVCLFICWMYYIWPIISIWSNYFL